MQRFAYRIQEFAKSELESPGLAMSILILSDDAQRCCLQVFELAGWQKAIGSKHKGLILAVQDKLYRYRQYSRKPYEDSAAIFEALDEWSVGALRTAYSGSAVLPPFEAIHPELAPDREGQLCSADSFQALMKALLEHPDTGVLKDDDNQLPTYRL